MSRDKMPMRVAIILAPLAVLSALVTAAIVSEQVRLGLKLFFHVQ